MFFFAKIVSALRVKMLSIATTGSQSVVCSTHLSATHGSLTAGGLDEHWWTSRHGATLDRSICWHLIVIEVTAPARVFEEWSNCIRWLNCLLSSSCFLRGHTTALACAAVQRKRAVTACFSSGRLLLLALPDSVIWWRKATITWWLCHLLR